jgi:ABC-type multidrug transport system fused ATPase/permease subunit
MRDPAHCENNMNIWKLVTGFIKENKTLFVIYVIFLFILPLQSVGLPHMLGKILSAIQNKEAITCPMLVIFGIIVLIQIGYSLADYVEVKMIPLIQQYARNLVLNHIFKIQDTNYEELQLGLITSKLVRLPTTMYTFIELLKNMIIPQIFTIVASVAYVIVINPLLGIILLLLSVSLILGVLSTVNRCGKISLARDNMYTRIYEEVDDILRNITTVLNYNMTTKEIERIDKVHEKYTLLSEQSLTCSLKIRYVFIPLVLSYLAFFFYYAYGLVAAKKMPVSSFIALVVVVLYVSNLMWAMMGKTKDIVFKWGVMQECLSIFNVCSTVKNDTEKWSHTMVDNGIYMKEVKHSYVDLKGMERTVFENLNIMFKPGEKVLIMGEIGAGKTTLLKLLMKYHEPSSGEIFLNGLPYSSLSTSIIRQRIGYIPQSPILLNRTLFENITYGLSGVSRHDVLELFDSIGLSSFISSLSEGLDTNVGKYGSKLSGGQRQIVWIVRTMLHNPEVIIMDEPTAAIDEKTRNIVLALLTRLMQGKTVITVTHDDFLISIMDRVIRLQNGVVVSDTYVSKRTK